MYRLSKMPKSTHDPFDASQWGPALWKILHTTAAQYPDNPTPQYKASCRQFFYALRHMLPCDVCRTHYTQLLSQRQPQVNSGTELQQWVLWLHNQVNKRTGSAGGKEWTMAQLEAQYPPKNSETKETVVTATPPSQQAPRTAGAPRTVHVTQRLQNLQRTLRNMPAKKVEPQPIPPQVVRTRPAPRNIPRTSHTVSVSTSHPKPPPPVLRATPITPSPARPATRSAKMTPKRRMIRKRLSAAKNLQNTVREFGIPGTGLAPRKGIYRSGTRRRIPKRKKKGCGCGK
jgi:hypothetical protein